MPNVAQLTHGVEHRPELRRRNPEGQARLLVTLEVGVLTGQEATGLLSDGGGLRGRGLDVGDAHHHIRGVDDVALAGQLAGGRAHRQITGLGARRPRGFVGAGVSR